VERSHAPAMHPPPEHIPLLPEHAVPPTAIAGTRYAAEQMRNLDSEREGVRHQHDIPVYVQHELVAVKFQYTYPSLPAVIPG